MMVVARLSAITAIILLISQSGATQSSEQTNLLDNRQQLRLVIEELDRRYPLFPLVQSQPVGTPLFDLGRELFFSKSLSGNGDVSCASCHHPLLAGGDKLSLPVGESAYEPDLVGPGRWHNWQKSMDPNADGAPNVARHSQTTFNTSLYNRTLFYDGRIFVLDNELKVAGEGQQHRTPDSNLWQADSSPGTNLLASQARFPVVANDEMLGYTFAHNQTNDGVRKAIVARLIKSDTEDRWLALFQEAFEQPQATADQLLHFDNIEIALAHYQSTQVFIDNDWFAYLNGGEERLTDEQVRGALLFFKPVKQGGAGCVACHVPPTFTDESFHNIAVPQFGRGKQPDSQDFGRRNVSQKDHDRFGFRTPSLLNVTATEPYMHTGAFIDLESAVKHHLDPAASIKNFDFSFANNPQLKYTAHLKKVAKQHTTSALANLINKQNNGQSQLDVNAELTIDDFHALVKYLESLTDPCVENDECLSVWIPDDSVVAPDNNRLVATFSEHKPPLLPVAAAPKSLVTKAQFSQTNAPQIIDAELIEASKLGCSVGDLLNSEDAENFGFTEVGRVSGLRKKHSVSWPLYNLATAQRILFSGGVAAGDINGDCFADIFFPTGDTSPDILYLNNQDGSFIDQSKEWGITGKELSNGVTIVDIDGDYDLDVITSNLVHGNLPSIGAQENQDGSSQTPTLYINQAQTSFRVQKNTGIDAHFTSWSFAFADYDDDGDVDALSTHWRGPGLGGKQPNHLWENTSSQTQLRFEPADAKANLMELVGNTDFTFTGNFSDIDNDGNLDLLMAADFESSQVYRNLGNGSFVKVTQDSEITDKNGMGAAIIDYDNDGDLDWFVSSVSDPNGVAEGNWGTIGNRLYNNHNGRFTDVTEEAGVAQGLWAWGACFADFNNDQWPDIFHVNGFDLERELHKHLGNPYAYMKLKRSISEFEKTPSLLFISNQDGTFKDQAKEWGITDRLSGRAAVCFDYDRDGDVDILVSNHQNRLLLYKNNASQNENANFINIALVGAGKNTQAIGAKVFVTANGITQMQEVRVGGGFISSSPTDLHFGLSSATIVDEIKIVWPGSRQKTSSFINVVANNFYSIRQTKKYRADDELLLHITNNKTKLSYEQNTGQ
jgi:cytochrome c peroxidase